MPSVTCGGVQGSSIVIFMWWVQWSPVMSSVNSDAKYAGQCQ